jgi:hypothetical protein
MTSRLDFSGAQAPNSGFQLAHLESPIFTDAVLTGSDLTGAEFIDGDFRGTNLGGAILHAAIFQDCNLATVELAGADLTLVEATGFAANLLMPPVAMLETAKFWWLGHYPREYAMALGLSETVWRRNALALVQLRSGPRTLARIAFFVADMKRLAPRP